MSQGPEPLSEILARVFAARGWGQRQGRLRLEDAWRDAVGPDFARDTQLGAVRHGVLEVVVRDPVLMQELSGFQKRRVLEALQRTVGPMRITDLRFRLGYFRD